jgi:hypothetical protein
MSNTFVPVVDQEHHPLMPTTPARARRWIRSRKATHFWKGGVFCVRLNIEPSRCVQQPIAVGIDPGSKREGIVVASAPPHLPQYPGGGKRRCQGSGAGQHAHAPDSERAQDSVPAAAPEPQAEQEAAAAFYQSPLALETAPSSLALPALPGECLRGQSGGLSADQAGTVEDTPGARATVK